MTVPRPAAPGIPGGTGASALNLPPVVLRALVMVPLLCILAMLIVVPFTFVVATSFTGDGGGFTLDGYRGLWSGALGEAAINSAIVTVAGTFLSFVIGAGLAWLVARTDIPGKPFVYLVGIMPLFISLIVASITWSLLGAGRSGYLNLILAGIGIPWQLNMRSLTGISLIEGIYHAPYAFIFIFSALTLVNPDMEEAASVHGGTVVKTARRITFPLVKPAAIGSILLLTVMTVEDFAVQHILGSPVGIETLATSIYSLMTYIPPQPAQASAFSVVLTAIVCVLVYAQRRVLAGKDYRTVSGKGMRGRMIGLGMWRWPALAAVALYAFVALGIPLLALVIGAMRSSMFVADAAALFDVSDWTFAHVAGVIADPAVQNAFRNSIVANLATALFGGAFFFLIAYVVHRTDMRGRQILEYGAMIPIAFPSIVLGLGILWTWVGIPLPVYGTLAIIVVGFITRFMPQGYRAVASSISQVHEDLEYAAMVAGASRATAVRRITLPLVRGGVVAAAFMMFILGFRELTTSLFLFTTETRTVAIMVFERHANGEWAPVASICLLYTVLLIVLTFAGRRFLRADV